MLRLNAEAERHRIRVGRVGAVGVTVVVHTTEVGGRAGIRRPKPPIAGSHVPQRKLKYRIQPKILTQFAISLFIRIHYTFHKCNFSIYQLYPLVDNLPVEAKHFLRHFDL